MAVTVNIPIENAVTDGSLNPVTSNAVFDGLAGKASGTGTANGTNTGDETTNTIKTKLGSASGSTDGYLLQADWNTFNGKQASLGFTPENVANKQNSLAVDGTGSKFPTVDAVNGGLAAIPKSMPITMLSSGVNEFSIVASCIFRPTVPSNVNGQTVTWSAIEDASHQQSFIRSFLVNGSNQVRLVYPTVKKIGNMSIAPDESFVEYNFNCGASVGLSYTDVSIRSLRVGQGRFRGNGSGGWASRGYASDFFTFSNINGTTGLIRMSTSSSNRFLDSESIIIQYTGTNNYRILRDYASIGLTGVVADFYLIDNATGLAVTTNPTSSDSVTVVGGSLINTLRTNTYSDAPIGGNSFMFSGSFNFWCIGLFELWMKAVAKSTTEILVNWQAKTGVTSYTLKRATAYTVDVNGNYVLTTPTTIYTGTDLTYTDTGLTTNTMYYYQLLDQTATEITQFNTKTL